MTATTKDAAEVAKAIETLAKLKSDPELFVRSVLGVKIVTPDQSRLYASVRDFKRTAAPAGHSVGKTFAAASVALWFLYTRKPAWIVTTAPSWSQVEELLWREVRNLHGGSQFPLGGDPLTTKLELGDDWIAVGRSTNDPNRFQGRHAENVLIIIDEATGVPSYIYETSESMAVSPADRILAIGNPTDPSSTFREKCQSDLWNVVEISCENHPNVTAGQSLIPGAVTREWISERLEDYGGRDSILYRARVLGKWPAQGENTLISLLDLEKSALKWRVPSGSPIATGTDVARFGTDLTVLFPLYGDYMLGEPTVKRGQNLMATAGMIVAAGCDRNGIDDTGLGGGATDRLAELGHPVTPLNFGSNADDEKKFVDLRSELWWQMRQAIREWLIVPPEKHATWTRLLWADLTNARYGMDSRGRIKLEPKADMKKRLGRSPDYADALCIMVRAHAQGGFAENAESASFGSSEFEGVSYDD